MDLPFQRQGLRSAGKPLEANNGGKLYANGQGSILAIEFKV